MDIFDSFYEFIATHGTRLLIVPGIIAAVSGLLLWLAGLRLLHSLAVFFAAGAGLACAMAFTSRQWLPLACLTLIPAAIALFVEKPVVVLLGACLAGAAVVALPLTDPAVRQAVFDHAGAVPSPDGNSVLNPSEYAAALSRWAKDWAAGYWNTVGRHRRLAALGAALAVLGIGIAAWRWVCALTTSTLGTALLLGGLTVLVLLKSPQGAAYLDTFRPYSAMIAGGMAAVGTVFNYVLGPVTIKHKKPHESQVQGEQK